MITAILVMFVVSLLVATMMYTNFHNANATAKNRSWGQSVHVAESGVQAGDRRTCKARAASLPLAP